jgi:hypothetical protein
MPLPEDKLYNTDHSDLIVLSSVQGEADGFTRFIMESVLPRLHRWGLRVPRLWRKPLVGSGNNAIYVYTDAGLGRVANNFALIVAALLPPLTIVALHFIKNVIAKLGFILGFSAVFTFLLAFFTGAKRTEIFTAAVALASVQVVYVGTST